MEQTEKLIKRMLQFLDSSSDESDFNETETEPDIAWGPSNLLMTAHYNESVVNCHFMNNQTTQSVLPLTHAYNNSNSSAFNGQVTGPNFAYNCLEIDADSHTDNYEYEYEYEYEEEEEQEEENTDEEDYIYEHDYEEEGDIEDNEAYGVSEEHEEASVSSKGSYKNEVVNDRAAAEIQGVGRVSYTDIGQTVMHIDNVSDLAGDGDQLQTDNEQNGELLPFNVGMANICPRSIRINGVEISDDMSWLSVPPPYVPRPRESKDELDETLRTKRTCNKEELNNMNDNSPSLDLNKNNAWSNELPDTKDEARNHSIDDLQHKLKAKCRGEGDTFLSEVKHSIYTKSLSHPPNGSPEYFQAAQNYAIFGKAFLDMPKSGAVIVPSIGLSDIMNSCEPDSRFISPATSFTSSSIAITQVNRTATTTTSTKRTNSTTTINTSHTPTTSTAIKNTPLSRSAPTFVPSQSTSHNSRDSYANSPCNGRYHCMQPAVPAVGSAVSTSRTLLDYKNSESIYQQAYRYGCNQASTNLPMNLMYNQHATAPVFSAANPGYQNVRHARNAQSYYPNGLVHDSQPLNHWKVPTYGFFEQMIQTQFVRQHNQQSLYPQAQQPTFYQQQHDQRLSIRPPIPPMNSHLQHFQRYSTYPPNRGNQMTKRFNNGNSFNSRPSPTYFSRNRLRGVNLDPPNVVTTVTAILKPPPVVITTNVSIAEPVETVVNPTSVCTACLTEPLVDVEVIESPSSDTNVSL